MGYRVEGLRRSWFDEDNGNVVASGARRHLQTVQ